MKKIRSIEFENFRVYAKRSFEINTDKNVILLYGNNGFGKTAFFDGIEWGFTGKLERYSESAKEKNEYPVLKNNLAAAGDNGYVSIKLSDDTYIKREIKKSGTSDYNEGRLNVETDVLNNIFVRDAVKGKVDFYDNFDFSHLLSQELLNSFIRGKKDTERYNTVKRLFGLQRYEKFNPHIKMMLDRINEKVGINGERIREINSRIAVESSKLYNLEIDPAIKMKELNIIAGELEYKTITEANNTELEQFSDKCQQQKLELEISLTVLNQTIEELAYLEKNFSIKEEANKLLSDKRKSLLNCIESIRLLEYIDALSFIKHNLKECSEYMRNKTAYEDILVKHKEFESALLHNPILNGSDFDAQLQHIKELDVKYKAMVEAYYSGKKSKAANEQEIAALEKQLSEKFGLEKKLIKTAQEFLRENLTLEVCPVCRNKFNMTETLKQLEERLMSEYSPLFNELLRHLEERKILAAKNKADIEQQEKQIKETITGIGNVLSDKRTTYEAQVMEVNRKREIANAVLSKLDLFKLPADGALIDGEYAKTVEAIGKNAANNDKQYYIFMKQELENSIVALEADLKNYTGIKQKHKVGTIAELDRLLSGKSAENKKLTDRVAVLSRGIFIANELIEYFKSRSVKESIDSLDGVKRELEGRNKVLYTIQNEYELLSKSVRRVIEDETLSTLDRYMGNIRKMYSYLNPHVYLNGFDIKIDDTNRQNNRLIFEVFNDEKKKVNPSYIFSSAQNNVLALSIFLSFAFFQDWSNLNFICLDDPIQNMDDINIFNFIDIIRALINETDKQIYISTHDDRIYNFMLKKFRGNVQAFRFIKYGEAIEDVI